MSSIGASLQFLEKYPRTHHNGGLRKTDVGREVVLMGWIATRRDHGGIVFVDLRDLEGLTQVVFDPQINADSHRLATDLRSEFCIGIRGKVRARPEGMINANLPTGEIEVEATHLEVFNSSPTPPFPIEDGITTNEMVRLEHRYLDLRRPEAKKPLLIRAKLTHFIRKFLEDRDFYEIETPFLTKSTPEGARDYLVPSRLYPGHAYALPQSPQLFKQLLMMAGFERYFQIARCFRDEDLRADRQPDFTQLDLEMSFITQDRLFALMEELWAYLWKEILGVKVETPFVRMKYADVMEQYGSDKPDLRLDWKLTTVTDVFAQSGFKVFKDVAEQKGLIQTLKVPGGAELSRKDLDELTPFAKTYGAKGIAWIKINKIEDFNEGWQSPISKFLTEAEKKALQERTNLKTGDLLIFCADKKKIVADSLGNIRLELGKKMKATKTDEWKFLWVVDFPLFQWDEEGKRWVSEHHPFTSPKPEFVDTFHKDPGKTISDSYDLVLNGMEMGSGSIRIHNPELQSKVFDLLKLSQEEAREKFGFLLDALSYGAPPHGGVAFGVDRIAMVLSKGESLREVIAFPKTQRGQCPLTKAPSMIEPNSGRTCTLNRVRRSNGEYSFFIGSFAADIGPWWPVEEKKIRAITSDFSFHLIRGRGHAEHITRELQKSGTKLLVCAGGDRLVHEVVNALSERTSMDVCLHHEIYQGNLRKLRPTSRSFLEFLQNYLGGERRVVALDLGEARYQGQYGETVKRYFFSHASFGLPAAVLHRLPEPSVRRQAFRVLLRLVPFYRSPAFKFELNGKSLSPRYLLGGFVQNLPWAARGIRVAKEAQADDSLLDLIILNRASWPRTIWAAFRLLFKDELTGQFLQRESLRHLKIESTTGHRHVRIEIDGESWGHLPVEIENRALQLKILE